MPHPAAPCAEAGTDLPAVPPPVCTVPAFPYSMQGANLCLIDFVASGECRTYRTSTDGRWYSNFKPVLDCAAQSSPAPKRPAPSGACAALGPAPTEETAPCTC